MLVSGQLIRIGDKQFIDTSGKLDKKCTDLDIYYYQADAKYLQSSYTVLKNVQKFLEGQSFRSDQNGFITFRFIISCEGQIVRFAEVLQTDENYTKNAFEDHLIRELYRFTLELKRWKVIRNKEGRAYPYRSFITFKIKNGFVENVIP